VPEALRAAQAEATWFTLLPALGRIPGYTLLLEPRGPLDDARLQDICLRAEAALGRVAADYGRLRAADHLAPLRIQALPQGTYDRVRQAKVADGSAEAQLKTAHLVSDVAALPEAIRAAIR